MPVSNIVLSLLRFENDDAVRRWVRKMRETRANANFANAKIRQMSDDL